MSEEEFFERAINRICKDYDYNFANELKNIYLKKDKKIQQKENIIKEVREYIKEHPWEEEDGFQIENVLEILDKEVN